MPTLLNNFENESYTSSRKTKIGSIGREFMESRYGADNVDLALSFARHWRELPSIQAKSLYDDFCLLSTTLTEWAFHYVIKERLK